MTTRTINQDSLTLTPAIPLNKKTKLLVLAQVGFAAMTAMGSSMELAAELHLVELPAAVQAALGKWHGSGFVRYWVLMSNILSLVISVGLVGVALGFLRARPTAATAAKLSRSMVVLFALGQVVMVSFVYAKMPPSALAPAIMGTVGSLVFSIVLWRFWTAQARRQHRSTPCL